LGFFPFGSNFEQRSSFFLYLNSSNPHVEDLEDMESDLNPQFEKKFANCGKNFPALAAKHD